VKNVTEFIKVTSLEKIPKGKMIKIVVKGIEIMLANVNGKIYAIDNICSHEECGLNEGNLEGYIVTCSCHGAKYDVRNGKGSKETPWGTGQDSFKVQ
jgi:nitrite reductase/ring-hydroxylating ferredoxin subunit